MAINIENKKQFATILLAVGLGLVAAFLMSYHVETSIKGQAKVLASDYSKKNAELAAALQQKMAQQQAGFDAKLSQSLKAQQIQMHQQLKKQLANLPKPSTPIKRLESAQITDKTVFATTTPGGKRATTIMIDSLSAVGGLIKPGDFVDIVADLKITEERDDKGYIISSAKEITSIIFQNVQVLAVGANFKPVGDEKVYQQQQKARSLNVTLALDPEEVGLLLFSQKYGKLQMALRPPQEGDTRTLEVAAWDSLADYVLDKQGTELDVPFSDGFTAEDDDDTTAIESEVSPFIEIFRAGEEL
jgi:Flp pilus assembly protein CpaB